MHLGRERLADPGRHGPGGRHARRRRPRPTAPGDYSLELPIGDVHAPRIGRRLHRDRLPPRSPRQATTSTQDFALFRKLDDFGHACAPIAVRLGRRRPARPRCIGDEIAGRLRLPFTFSFYGEAYDAGLPLRQRLRELPRAASPGYFIPTAIPSASSSPNAAIYPLWQDLYITEVGSIDSETIGTAPDRAFVIEYTDVQRLRRDRPLDFEVKLWENGTIDLLYGSNAAEPG